MKKLILSALLILSTNTWATLSAPNAFIKILPEGDYYGVDQNTKECSIHVMRSVEHEKDLAIYLFNYRGERASFFVAAIDIDFKFDLKKLSYQDQSNHGDEFFSAIKVVTTDYGGQDILIQDGIRQTNLECTILYPVKF